MGNLKMSRVNDLHNKQMAYIKKIGGFDNLKEADDYYNDLNRSIISAFFEENGEVAYIGKLNMYAKQMNEVKAESDVYKQYNGEKVYNFEYDYIIPRKDSVLDVLIKKHLFGGLGIGKHCCKTLSK